MRPISDRAFRRSAIEAIGAVLGPPEQTGDCMRWSASAADGALRYRLTVYHDGPDGTADGWLFIPEGSLSAAPQRFSVQNREDLMVLVSRCAAACGAPAKAPGA
jgi:hypothetical protein